MSHSKIAHNWDCIAPFTLESKLDPSNYESVPDVGCGPRELSWYSDSLRAGRSGDRIPVGGEIFRTRSDRPWGPPSLLYGGYRVFPGGKAAGAWRWPPTPSSAEVKERVGLYRYYTFGPSWPVSGWTLLFFTCRGGKMSHKIWSQWAEEYPTRNKKTEG